MTLELTKQGESKAIEGTLARSIRRDLGVPKDFPVFVPYSCYSKHVKGVSILIEGYAFVSTGLPETRYFSLESKPLVHRVLSTKGPYGMRILNTIPDHRVVGMQGQLREMIAADIEEGMIVKVTSGHYARLEGNVVDVCGDVISVRFPMRSLDVVAVFPRSSVTPDLSDDGIDGGDVPHESYEEQMDIIRGRGG